MKGDIHGDITLQLSWW